MGNYNLPSSNVYISLISQPILVKFWILHPMRNPNKVYDTTPNLRQSQPHEISTNLNHFKCLNHSQFLTDFGQILDSASLTQSWIPHQISGNLNHIKSQLISTISNAYISINSKPILVKLWIKPFHEQH